MVQSLVKGVFLLLVVVSGLVILLSKRNKVCNLGEIDRRQHLLDIFEALDFNLRQIQARLVGDGVHAALALLLLQLQRNSADRAALQALHQVSDEAGDLVANALGRDGSNFFADLLVSVEVKSHPRETINQLVLADYHPSFAKVERSQGKNKTKLTWRSTSR